MTRNRKDILPDYPTFRTLARAASPRILQSMVARALEGDVSAARLVLSYAWGLPAQTFTGEGGEGPVIVRFLAPGEPLPADARPVLTGHAVKECDDAQ